MVPLTSSHCLPAQSAIRAKDKGQLLDYLRKAAQPLSKKEVSDAYGAAAADVEVRPACGLPAGLVLFVLCFSARLALRQSYRTWRCGLPAGLLLFLSTVCLSARVAWRYS